MSADLLASVEQVHRSPEGAAVRFGGRVTACGGGALRVDDALASVLVAWADAQVEGSLVVVTGVRTARGVDASSVERVAAPMAAFPRAGGEFRALTDHARRRAGSLVRRAEILRGIRRFFDGLGFLEVETPSAVPSPGMDLHLSALEVRGLRGADGPAARWLATSPEYQMKRLLAGGLSRIYQLGRSYRADESGSRHQPEFTMLEWYRGFEDVEAVMRDTEQLVAALALETRGSTTIEGSRGPIDLAAPWERLTVRDAFARYAQLDVFAVLPDEERFFRVLVEQIEPELGRTRPVLLTEWPASMASLARLIPGSDPPVAERFEAFVDSLELCNGFGELTDPVEQRARFGADQRARRALGLDVYPIDERFLGALEEGLPPSGGNALGVDRLVMLLTGARDLRDVIAFSDERL